MATLFADAFEQTDFTRRYAHVGSPTTLVVGGGRDGQNCVNFGNANAMLAAAVNPANATFRVGFPAKNGWLFELWDGVSGYGQIVVDTASDRSIQVWRVWFNNAFTGHALSTLVAFTAPGVLSPSGYDFISIKGVLHSSAGQIAIKVNGALRLNATGLNLVNASSGVARYTLAIVGGAGSRWDYFRIQDDSGSVNNDWVLDKAKEVQIVNGAGNYSQWTPDSGSNYQMVDDATVDDDATKNTALLVNKIDTFTKPALVTIGGGIDLTQVVHTARKSASGTRAIKTLMRISGVDYLGAIEHFLSGQYNELVDAFEVSPATAAAFGVAEWDALEIGPKVTT